MHHIVKRKKYISISIRGFSRGGSSIIASDHLFASLQKLPRWKASTFGSPMLSTNSCIIGGTYVTWWDFDGTFPPHGWCAALPVFHSCGRSRPSFLSCVFYQMMWAYRVTCMSLPPHYDNFLSFAAPSPPLSTSSLWSSTTSDQPTANTTTPEPLSRDCMMQMYTKMCNPISQILSWTHKKLELGDNYHHQWPSKIHSFENGIQIRHFAHQNVQPNIKNLKLNM